MWLGKDFTYLVQSGDTVNLAGVGVLDTRKEQRGFMPDEFVLGLRQGVYTCVRWQVTL